MEKRQFAEKLLAAAQDRYQEAEVFYVGSTATSIELYNGSLEKFEIADSRGLQLAVIQDGVKALAYTEELTEASIDYLLDQVQAILDLKQPAEDLPGFYTGKDTLRPLPDQKKFQLDTEKAMASLQALQEEVQKCTSEAKMITLELGSSAGEEFIYNSKGLDRSGEAGQGQIVVYVVLARGEEMQNGFAFRVFSDLEEVKLADLAQEAVAKAEENFGGTSYPSGQYPVVIENDCFASLLMALASAFSAESVQKGVSLLKGKMGQQIASSQFSLYSDPLHPACPAPHTFDDEGVATQDLCLVDGGVLKSYLHTLETAKKDGTAPTGTGSRSYKGKASPWADFFYMKEGDKSFDQLLAEVGQGVLITDLAGLHSGLDPISGDFSLAAKGFAIEDGKKGRPLKQITIAGNLLDLLAGIKEVGADAKLSSYDSYIPSVYVESMAIAGDQD
ncbi:MAG: metallopeptidase TldD-related protein [Eubacteriales bacterium]|nr:metallopeptidase TldD-related protein [Clostridiales bacterium]MDY5835973.1 metallopeptidase TldD-related protein [Eubacteriales bacterium]